MLNSIIKQRKFFDFFAVLLSSTLAATLGYASPIRVCVKGFARSECLISAEELKSHITKGPKPVIVDVRPYWKYVTGHIPGSVQVWNTDYSDDESPFENMLAPKDKMEKLLGKLGIENRSTVVIYSDGIEHTRFWWALYYYGHDPEQLKILDGGISGWKGATYSFSRLPSLNKPKEYVVEKYRENVLATIDHVKSAIRNKLSGTKSIILWDTRSTKEYTGEIVEKGADRAGHIPYTDVNIDWRDFLNEDKTFKHSEEIKELLKSKDITHDKQIILYCHRGNRSSFVFFTLYVLGYPVSNLKNYDGSWIEWSRRKELPVCIVREGKRRCGDLLWPF
jgi:thiosulfate/3-mercaptopyruvate sulfurtransferase